MRCGATPIRIIFASLVRCKRMRRFLPRISPTYLARNLVYRRRFRAVPVQLVQNSAMEGVVKDPHKGLSGHLDVVNRLITRITPTFSVVWRHSVNSYFTDSLTAASPVTHSYFADNRCSPLPYGEKCRIHLTIVGLTLLPSAFSAAFYSSITDISSRFSDLKATRTVAS